jgi:hypothetical protein
MIAENSNVAGIADPLEDLAGYRLGFLVRIELPELVESIFPGQSAAEPRFLFFGSTLCRTTPRTS